MSRMTIETADLRLFRLFMTVVEAGGFTAAQSELNLSLSTISTHFAELEGRLGVRLCRRGRSGFKLTEEGQAVYDELRRVFDTLDRFGARVRGLRDRLTGTLSIGLVDNTLTDANFPLERVITRFADAAPEVNLAIATRPPNELLRDVIGGELHLAIASFPRIVPGLSYIDLYTETNLFYCGAGHPLFDRPDDMVDLDEVRRHRLVARSYWGARDIKIFAISAPHATVSDMEGAARLILSGRLRALLPRVLSYHSPFQIAVHSDRARTPVVDLFMTLTREEIAGR